MPAINDEAGQLVITGQDGGQLLDEAAAPVLPKSIFPLSILVELLINGAWVDVSTYVYYRDGITITGGKTSEADTAQPAQCNLTFDNRDGRFTPNFTAGAYYPWLQRNVQIRVSVAATSVTGNHYSGYRFWGEVHQWPPRSDPSATDVYVPITAHGPLRRIRRHGGQGSALSRYYATLTGSFAPIAYWPCEEDPDTTIVGAGLAGGTNMAVTVGTPKWRAVSDFNGSAPIGVLNRSTWDGLTGSQAGSGDDTFITPGTYPWVAPVTTVDARAFGSAGGGENGNGGGAAGGGGEFARNSALSGLVVGQTYYVTVPAGGQAGPGAFSFPQPGQDGGDAYLADNTGAVLLVAHGGKGGKNRVGGLGGTGSTAPTHFNGGNGGNGGSLGGAGGGSSAGTAANGNNGGTAGTNTGAAGGAAPAGGAAGGRGGDSGLGSPPASSGLPGVAPGGGGGGGGQNVNNGYMRTGGSGAPGKVELVYTPPSAASTNVLRFILFVPRHGGNPGKVLVRALTGGTIARLDVQYSAGGKLRLIGYNSILSILFDSGDQAWGVDGQTVMVSAELQNSGVNVAWSFKAIKPGSSALLGSTSGTVFTAAVGNMTEVLAGPNADVTKTALGHISVQYALVDLRRVSHVLHGHHGEHTVDRFLRLAKEEALDNVLAFNEEGDHFGFETGLAGWTGSSCVLTTPVTRITPLLNLHTFRDTWPTDGDHWLQLSPTGEGQPTATSPTGLAGQPVTVGDIVSVAVDVHSPTARNNVFCGLLWYTAAGAPCAHPEDDSEDTVMAAGAMTTIKVSAKAPTGAARYAVIVGNHATDAAGLVLGFDHVRTSPRMGPQTRKRLHHFIEEIERLEAIIIADTIGRHGIRYRTRISMFNQLPALTLDYPSAHLAGELSPTVDDKPVKNDITVHRHKGNKVRVQLDSGVMSVQEPPAGHGRHKHHFRAQAEVDEQIANLAAHILALGTDQSERYPVVSTNLARTAVADLVSAIAGIEISDFIKITNLPFWYPSQTVKQLVIGYTERLSQFQWEIDWNCTAENPWEISVTSIRRW